MRSRLTDLHAVYLQSVVLAAVAVVAISLPGAAETPGVTDLSGADASAIEASDIEAALGVPRGTRIEQIAPPTVRLPIYFEFNSAELRPDARALLSKVGVALKTEGLEPYSFSIEGHTDSIGDTGYNGVLSEQRAASARAFLISRGVEPERLGFVGRGELSPIGENESEEGRQMNRRVEIINLGMQ